MVPGDAKALAVMDLDQDGWPDFLITRNHSTTMAYRNNGMKGNRSTRVLLRGTGGNPTAIGAKITAHYADGSRQSAEIAAGTGYYSQSTASTFFGSTESHALESFEIRWPSGKSSTHAIKDSAKLIVLTEPST
jgi:hypothetical protein